MSRPVTAAGPVSVAAPAKLNLYLHVLGRRADGYHELDSLVAFADVHDTVTVRPAAALSLAVEGPMAGGLAAEPPADNLVVRAARGLAHALGREPDVAITLIKRLPVAAGIGGGSADAAACLRALARLWGLAADAPVVADLAPRLGGDVPVCLRGEAAYFGGIGDRLDPAPALPEAWVVLVNPRIPLATPAVFRVRTGPYSAPGRLERLPTDAADLACLLDHRNNDLTAAACSLVPVVGDVLHALERLRGCLLARMSGSGATCFGLFADASEAEAGAADLRAQHPGWWIAPARLSGAGPGSEG